jgi:hypothetical protein
MPQYLVMKTVTFTIKVEAEDEEDAFLTGQKYDVSQDKHVNYVVNDIEVDRA